MTDGANAPASTRPSAPSGFSVEVKRERETAELIPAGEVDLATIGQLQSELETLIKAGFARVVIDLRGVEFLDSTGLHALLDANARAGQDGWQLAIIPGPRAVQRIFEITGVTDRLPFVGVDGGARSSETYDHNR
jgi:anti-sigma B factor antagonist